MEKIRETTLRAFLLVIAAIGAALFFNIESETDNLAFITHVFFDKALGLTLMFVAASRWMAIGDEKAEADR